MNARALLTGCCLWLITAAAGADVAPFVADYQVVQNTFTVGEVRFELSKAGPNRYRYESSSRPSGLVSWFLKDQVSESSLWTYNGKSIRPLEYFYNRSGGKKERHAHLTFDWENRTVRNDVDGQPWQMDITEGTLDKLVVTLAMMLDLQQKREKLSYTIADGGKLKTYRFRVVNTETVETPAGAFKTVKIERVREDDKRSTYLWCAPELAYLPVKIEQQEKDGPLYRSLLKAYNPPAKPAP